MKIIVLVKHVPDYEEPRSLDEESGLLDRSGDGALDEINSRALSWALAARRQLGGEVIALTMGPEQAGEALRQALALGADEAVHIQEPALAGSDAPRTAQGAGLRPASGRPIWWWRRCCVRWSGGCAARDVAGHHRPAARQLRVRGSR